MKRQKGRFVVYMCINIWPSVHSKDHVWTLGFVLCSRPKVMNALSLVFSLFPILIC